MLFNKVTELFFIMYFLSQIGSPIKKFMDIGCSRTNPIEWGSVNVKKEPGACQVAEISTSISPIVKLEVTSPIQKNDGGFLNSSIINTNGKFFYNYLRFSRSCYVLQYFKQYLYEKNERMNTIFYFRFWRKHTTFKENIDLHSYSNSLAKLKF